MPSGKNGRIVLRVASATLFGRLSNTGIRLSMVDVCRLLFDAKQSVLSFASRVAGLCQVYRLHFLVMVACARLDL